MEASRTVAFLCGEGTGHLNPMLGLAGALAECGWGVHFFVPGDAKQLVQGVGAHWHPLAPDNMDLKAAAEAGMNELGLQAAPDVPLNYLPFRVVPATWILVPHLARAVLLLRPHFLVFDAAAPWGLVLSEVLGIPAVSSMSALPTSMAERERGSEKFAEAAIGILEAVAAAIKKAYNVEFNHNHSYQTYAPYTLVTTSRCWHQGHEEFPPDQFHYWGALISERKGLASAPGQAEVERLLADETLGRGSEVSERSLFFCSLGTVMTGVAFARYAGIVRQYYRTLLQAAALMPDVSFIFAVGQRADLVEEEEEESGILRIVELFGAGVPRNVVVARSVDQPRVLARADGFLTHCGQNSTMEAIDASVPVVAAPFQGDQIDNALRFEALGCGLLQSFYADLRAVGGFGGTHNMELVTAESVANAMQRVLVEPQFGAAMEELRRRQEQEVGQPISEKISHLVASMGMQAKGLEPRLLPLAPARRGTLGGM